MRLGEILKTKDVQKYLTDQLRDLNKLSDCDYIMAYPETKQGIYSEGYKITFLPVTLLFSVKFKYTNIWGGTTLAKAQLAKTIEFIGQSGFYPDGMNDETKFLLLATEGYYAYAFVKSLSGKKKWIRLGELMSKERRENQ